MCQLGPSLIDFLSFGIIFYKTFLMFKNPIVFLNL